ncbi:hypothetical protein [Achromobacter insolitus]|uniref:hypothetical protein n=1 Tax=Achromobacter insolitus TaxID=217204 RepID=UPI0020A2BCCA|nr:hypothetical protein [Achromobacter insolitus]MCP1404259.1 hypothetical protein [Achromobacter insolitus]
MKVEIQMKDGSVKALSPSHARAMVFIGRAQYLTRDLTAGQGGLVSAQVGPVADIAGSDSGSKRRGRPRKAKSEAAE